MRWTAILTGLALFAAGAAAETPDDAYWYAHVKRARIAFTRAPDFEAGGVRGTADFRIDIPRDELAPARRRRVFHPDVAGANFRAGFAGHP